MTNPIDSGALKVALRTMIGLFRAGQLDDEQKRAIAALQPSLPHVHLTEEIAGGVHDVALELHGVTTPALSPLAEGAVSTALHAFELGLADAFDGGHLDRSWANTVFAGAYNRGFEAGREILQGGSGDDPNQALAPHARVLHFFKLGVRCGAGDLADHPDPNTPLLKEVYEQGRELGHVALEIADEGEEVDLSGEEAGVASVTDIEEAFACGVSAGFDNPGCKLPAPNYREAPFLNDVYARGGALGQELGLVAVAARGAPSREDLLGSFAFSATTAVLQLWKAHRGKDVNEATARGLTTLLFDTFCEAPTKEDKEEKVEKKENKEQTREPVDGEWDGVAEDLLVGDEFRRLDDAPDVRRLCLVQNSPDDAIVRSVVLRPATARGNYVLLPRRTPVRRLNPLPGPAVPETGAYETAVGALRPGDVFRLLNDGFRYLVTTYGGEFVVVDPPDQRGRRLPVAPTASATLVAGGVGVTHPAEDKEVFEPGSVLEETTVDRLVPGDEFRGVNDAENIRRLRLHGDAVPGYPGTAPTVVLAPPELRGEFSSYASAGRVFRLEPDPHPVVPDPAECSPPLRADVLKAGDVFRFHEADQRADWRLLATTRGGLEFVLLEPFEERGRREVLERDAQVFLLERRRRRPAEKERGFSPHPLAQAAEAVFASHDFDGREHVRLGPWHVAGDAWSRRVYFKDGDAGTFDVVFGVGDHVKAFGFIADRASTSSPRRLAVDAVLASNEFGDLVAAKGVWEVAGATWSLRAQQRTSCGALVVRFKDCEDEVADAVFLKDLQEKPAPSTVKASALLAGDMFRFPGMSRGLALKKDSNLLGRVLGGAVPYVLLTGNACGFIDVVDASQDVELLNRIPFPDNPSKKE